MRISVLWTQMSTSAWYFDVKFQCNCILTSKTSKTLQCYCIHRVHFRKHWHYCPLPFIECIDCPLTVWTTIETRIVMITFPPPEIIILTTISFVSDPDRWRIAKELNKTNCDYRRFINRMYTDSEKHDIHYHVSVQIIEGINIKNLRIFTFLGLIAGVLSSMFNSDFLLTRNRACSNHTSTSLLILFNFIMNWVKFDAPAVLNEQTEAYKCTARWSVSCCAVYMSLFYRTTYTYENWDEFSSTFSNCENGMAKLDQDQR